MSIKIAKELDVHVQCNGCMVALPHSLFKGKMLTKFSMMLDFPSYMKNNISENEYTLLEELRAKQFHEPKGRPSFLADVIC